MVNIYNVVYNKITMISHVVSNNSLNWLSYKQSIDRANANTDHLE